MSTAAPSPARAALALLTALLTALLAAPAPAAELVPGGEAGRRRLLTGGPDEATVVAAVDRDGYHAGAAIGDGACARCHPDVAAQWAASAHRFSSFNNPYYTAAARGFHAARGPVGFRFCADCHDPALVVSGDITAIEPRSRAAQAGIGCLLCHSIQDPPPLTGNARYTARLDPVPLGDGHGARVRPAGAADGRLCGSCHRVGLDEQVSGDRWRRGQDDFFAWVDSPWSGNGADAILRPAAPAGCVDCHMPRVAATDREKAARDGQIRDHRFLGAGTALARLRGDSSHESATEAFLRDAVSIHLAPTPAVDGVLDVVLVNRRAGHRFPGGVQDQNLAWLEVTARDAAGAVIARSGALAADGALPPDAHRIRAQPVDAAADPLVERAVDRQRSVVYDTGLHPLMPKAARYALPPATARVEVRLLYRQFEADYAAFACAPLPAPVRARCLDLPVTEVTRAAADVQDGRVIGGDDGETLLVHGLALAGGLAGDALAADALLARAATALPGRPEPHIARALAAAALGRTDAALAHLDAADRLQGAPPARHFVRATTLLAAYRIAPARAAAEALAAELPRDRRALALLARLRDLDGDHPGALAAADAVIALDPEDPAGWYPRLLATRALGQTAAAEIARTRWRRHRTPDEAALAARRAFRARHPALAAHLEPIPSRALAAP
ncbi:MAG: hypothetical protein H6703_17350 [Myxococcales bacterium]|nr:hypothetical protein [Myxococcales bacterium]MCB9544197.1 hypothetical protein [Myxococcales bacterium]